MSDYASKARRTHPAAPVSRPAAKAGARRPASAAGHGPQAQAIAQLRRSIGGSPRVAQLAEIASALQRRGHAELVQAGIGPVQREQQEEELQGRFVAQRAAADEDMLQGKRAGAAGEVSGATQTPAPNQTGMPDHLKTGVESLSGMDLSDVRVHANSAEPARLNAYAYAQGSDIHVGPGQERHLAHEAWHVVQQRQGRVRPTSQLKGVSVNDDRGLEAEADRMGARAVQLADQSPERPIA